MPVDYLRLSDSIDAIDLLRRWPGVTEEELATMTKDETLPAYWEAKRLKNPEGAIVSFCTGGAKPAEHWQGNETLYDWDKLIFRLFDVEEMERENEHYKWIPQGAEGQEISPPDNDEPEDEWISCNALAERWGWSPFDVQALLYANELRFRRHYGHYGAPDVDDLGDASVHRVDLQRWEAENADRIRNAPVLAKDGQRLREENKALATKVAEFEALNVALRSELEAERTKPARTGPPEHLEKAKDEKTAERWKRNMRSGLTLAVHVMAVGKPFTTRELEQACSSLECSSLGEEAMRIFRETMPAECINTGGRPPKKKTSE